MAPISSLAIGRFKQLPQRTREVWQGALAPLPMWVDDPANPTRPLRPMGAIWRSLHSGRIHVAVVEPEQDPAGAALDALIEFAKRESKLGGSRPSRVHVRDHQLQAALATALTGTDTVVDLVPDVPAVDEALRDLEAAQGPVLPGYLAGKGVTVERVRSLAEAAAAFHHARIWQHLGNDDVIVVESPTPPKTMSHLSVLGNGGEQFGLAFFPSRAAFEKLIAGDPRRVSKTFGLTFDPPEIMPFADLDLWAAQALPLTTPTAYPLFAELSSGGGMRRPDAPALTMAEALLRALADTSEADLDAGRWHRDVTTFDGPVTVTLSLPDVVNETRRSSAGAADHDSSNRRPLTRLQQAQELVYEAYDATGRRRITLARSALELSADCADAWSLLAEAAATLEEAASLYGKAVEAGRRALGENGFDALAGHFWSDMSTRPYMRARQGLAATLTDLDRVDEAIAHYDELLALNANDNQGNRYVLLPLLLECNRDDAARALVEQYSDDAGTEWAYGRALLAFRAQGESAGARQMLREAIAANRHVARFLLEPESMPDIDPPYVTLGGADEAAGVCDAFAGAFAQTPRALEWLSAEFARAPRGVPRGRGTPRSRRRTSASE